MNFSILGDLSLCFQERVSLIPVRILLIVDAKRKGRVIELEGMGAKKFLPVEIDFSCSDINHVKASYWYMAENIEGKLSIHSLNSNMLLP